MRIVSAVVLALPLLASAGKKPKAPKAPPPTLCAAEEKVMANCVSTDKKKKVTTVASVCASRDLAADKGTLQFRMGTAGQPAEVTFPEAPAHPARHFKLSLMNVPHQGFSHALQFSAGGKGYEFSHGGNYMEDRLMTSVRVEENGKSTSYVCGEYQFDFDMSSPGDYGIPETEE